MPHTQILGTLRTERAEAEARASSVREKHAGLGRAMSELRGRIARAETEASTAEADRTIRKREDSREEEEEVREQKRLKARLNAAGVSSGGDGRIIATAGPDSRG